MQQSQQNPDEKEDHEKDNPALSKVIERNIRTIIHLRTKAEHELTRGVRQDFGVMDFLPRISRIDTNF